jgi:hypothetical protein
MDIDNYVWRSHRREMVALNDSNRKPIAYSWWFKFEEVFRLFINDKDPFR